MSFWSQILKTWKGPNGTRRLQDRMLPGSPPPPHTHCRTPHMRTVRPSPGACQAQPGTSARGYMHSPFHIGATRLVMFFPDPSRIHHVPVGVHTQPQLNTTLKQAGASGASPASGDPVGITTFLLRWSVCVLCSAMMPTTRPVQSHFSIPCFRSPSQGCGVKLPPLPQTAPLHLPRPAGSERWRGTHGRGRGKGK